MFKKDEYIVTLELEDYIDVCAKENYCFKVERNNEYLTMYKDLRDVSNGHSVLMFDKSKKLLDWRYATQEEIEEYERLDKPYDVTTLEFKLPEKWCCFSNTSEERESLNDYVCSKGYINRLIDNWYIHYPLLGNGGSAYSTIQNGYTEITFKQFQKYVINKESVKVVKEDLSYLKNILSKIT